MNSQTACAEMTLRVLGVGEGDEVITCAYTYTASASVVCHVGAKLVLIDTQKDSLEMDYEKLADAINQKKLKVIIPIDLGGVPCDYDRIFSIVESKKHLFHPSNDIQKAIGRIIVMTDAAHAFGAEWHGKKVGSIADFSNFSFHAVKILQLQKAELLRGKILRELIMKDYIININCFPFTDSQKMLLLRLSLVHGNMISSVHGINAI